MKRIGIDVQPMKKHTEAILSSHLLFSETAAKELQQTASLFALFCDDNVAALFGNKWAANLQNFGLNVTLFTFPSGEKEKCREKKEELENLLFSQKFGRDVCIIALGGGVATDLIGFLASTYCRGVSLILVPTTLLAMVDAAIGGKTGVNTRFGKNLIGTFYPAEKILIDPAILSSLPPSEWTNGLAEVIKYALIRSSNLFDALKKWNPQDQSYLEKIIQECIAIKAQIVEKDYEEKAGVRRILNFGHTIAHALELLENYRLSHGEAVAIGMLAESYISMKMGLIPDSLFMEIEKMIKSFPFALRISSTITLDHLSSALALDKKASKGAVRFVLLDKIGACNPFDGEYCSEVPTEILNQALTWTIDQFGENHQ